MRPLRHFSLRVIAAFSRLYGRHRAGIGLASRRWSLQMSNNLNLAQAHAVDLARTLMVPVILFEVDGEFGVIPSDELDGDEVHVLYEYDPFELGPVH
jgi:hypothetical protein